MFEALHGFGLDTFAASRFLLSLRSPGYQVFRILPDGQLTAFDENEGNMVAIPAWAAAR